MKLCPNSIFANVFYANNCFQASLFFRSVNTLIRVSCYVLGVIRALRVVCQFLFRYSNFFSYFVDKTIYFRRCLLKNLIKLILIVWTNWSAAFKPCAMIFTRTHLYQRSKMLPRKCVLKKWMSRLLINFL